MNDQVQTETETTEEVELFEIGEVSTDTKGGSSGWVWDGGYGKAYW